MHARTRGHGEDKKQFGGARRIRDTRLHGIEMAADMGSVHMSDRYIEARAGAELLGRRHDGLGAPSNSRIA